MILLLLALCASAGLAIALYFSLVTFRVISGESPFIPRFCRMGKATCGRLLHHPDARVFGLPNCLLGTAYYLALIAFLIWGGTGRFTVPVRVAAWSAVALGVYLSYSLIVRLGVPCRLCLAAHFVNLLIAVSLFWI